MPDIDPSRILVGSSDETGYDWVLHDEAGKPYADGNEIARERREWPTGMGARLLRMLRQHGGIR